MATIKQKQTAANKILRISKKNNIGCYKKIYSTFYSNKTSYIYVVNSNSLSIICPIKEAKSSNLAEIFTKRDKEFKYV